MAGFPEYLAPIAHKLEEEFEFVDQIGRGANGITYKLKGKKLSGFYCLKTISPRIEGDDERNRVRDTLKKEVEILNPLNHLAVPRVYAADCDCDLPFYICTYHPGITWEKFRNNNKPLRADESIYVVHLLIDALEHIHRFGRTHCDLHQDNILISPRVYAEGVMIIDFGSGHRASDPDPYTYDRGALPFKNARGERRHRHKVARADAMQDFASYDFSALGRALWTMSPILFADASVTQLEDFKFFCSRLRDGGLSDWNEVRENFEIIADPRHLIAHLDKFFVSDDGVERALAIPGNPHVPIGSRIEAILNTSIYQRLRHVRQLSFCEYEFPGGTHSRYEHSLGVFDVTRRALEHLSFDRNFREVFGRNNIRATMLASLVHDVGHYPFAHVIEHYVSGRFPNNESVKSAIHHFDYSLDLIQKDPELSSAIGKSWGEDDAAECISILKGKKGALSQLLDSSIDTDKIDYLKRDSWHCGVPYGDGFNTDEIIHALSCDEAGDGIVFKSDHIAAVEGFMILQDQMLTAVYWHEKVRAIFAMFHRFLDGAVGDDAPAIVDLVSRMKKCNTEYECVQNVFVPLLNRQSKIGSEKRGTQEELEPLVRMHFRPNSADVYVPFARFTIFDRVRRKGEADNNVYDNIINSPHVQEMTGRPIDWEKVRRLRQCFFEAFKERGAKPGRFEIIVDVPWGKASGRDIPIVDVETGDVFPLTQISHLSKTIFERPTAFSAPIRVFIAPRLYQQYSNYAESLNRQALEKFFDKAMKFAE